MDWITHNGVWRHQVDGCSVHVVEQWAFGSEPEALHNIGRCIPAPRPCSDSTCSGLLDPCCAVRLLVLDCAISIEKVLPLRMMD